VDSEEEEGGYGSIDESQYDSDDGFIDDTELVGLVEFVLHVKDLLRMHSRLELSRDAFLSYSMHPLNLLSWTKLSSCVLLSCTRPTHHICLVSHVPCPWNEEFKFCNWEAH
jgi:hypothetical protein